MPTTRKTPAAPAPAPAPAQRRVRRTKARLIPIVLLGMACASPLLASAIRRSDDASLGTQGYVRIVNMIFGRMHWLQRVDTTAEDADATHVVDLSPVARANPRILEFTARSPLYADIAANDESLWRFDGDAVSGIDPRARPLPDPFAETDWRGDILYGNATGSATLSADDGRRIAITFPPPAGAGSPPANSVLVPIEPARAPAQQAAQTDGATPVAITGSDIIFVDGRDADRLARVQLVGQNIIVTPLDTRTADIVVDERRGTRRAGSGTSQQLRTMIMADQGRIRFRRDGAWVGTAFRLSSARPALSTFRYFSPRLTDDSFGPLGGEIERAVLAAGVKSGRAVQTTLDRDLQLWIQDDLKRSVVDLQRASARRFRAAVTVMDVLSGDVMALASVTSEPSRNGQAEIDGAGRNNNLVAMPIGSVAKVPLAAAIVSQYPELRFLRITGGEKDFKQVLGLHLDDAHHESAWRAATLDFETFLEQSSNRYATALMLMGLSVNPWQAGPCSSEPFWLPEPGGDLAVRRTRAPSFQLGGNSDPCSADRLPSGNLTSLKQVDGRRQNWFGLFGEIFDVEGIEETPTDLRFNVGIWDGLETGTGKDARERAARVMASVSPELESFGFGSANKLWEDYVNIILGGSRSRWTTIKVAEAYSRVVTGRRIVARFVRAPSETPLSEIEQIARLEAPPAPDASDPWPLDGEARLSILNGMSRAGQSGTAKLLRDPVAHMAAPPGQFIRLFAKTGTPQLPTSVVIPERVVLNRLAGEGLIGLVNRRVAVLRLRPNESERDALARLPARKLGGFTPEALASELAAVREELRARPRPVVGANGISIPVSRTFTETESANRPTGGAITFVIGRYCNGDAYFAKPLAAVTVVINIEQRSNPDRNPATYLAARLLRAGSPIARLLEQRPADALQECHA